MTDKRKQYFRSFSFNLISAFMSLIILMSLTIATIGYVRFTMSFQEQYTDSAYRTGETAEILVAARGEGNEYLTDEEGNVLLVPGAIDYYLSTKGETEEYKEILRNINILTIKQNVSIVYVIKVKDDFSGYYSVFNSPNPYTTTYTPWEVGTEHPIEDSEYKEFYKQLYSKEIKHVSAIRKGSGSIPDHVTSLMAMYDTNGEVTALMCVQRPMSGLSQARRQYMVVVAIFTGVLLVGVALTWHFYLKRQFADPLKKVVAEAERFAKTTSAPEEQLNTKISRILEISSLAESVNNMEVETLEYINNLTNITKEREKFNAELDVARQIQESSLQVQFPPFPNRKEFDLYASMTAAKQVGGDFYDFFFVDEDRLALVIADVSGKGVPAALFMMVTKILINEMATHFKTAGEILTAINERICAHNTADMFVTVWLGILDLKTGKLDISNGGHDDPAIYRKGKSFAIEQTKHGFVVGGLEGVQYKDAEIQLYPGDKIFLYTDGVTEATREDKAMFQFDGMLSALQKHRNKDPQKIIEGVKADVEKFVAGAPQFDDMTMLCLEYKGNIKTKKLKVLAIDENLDEINNFIEENLNAVKCPAKVIKQLLVATEEIYVNIAHYAYTPEMGDATVEMDVYDNSVTMRFIDSGKAYNPLDRQDPDISLSAEDRNIGGLGIFMTKKLVNEVNYKRENNKNILTLEKNFE